MQQKSFIKNAAVILAFMALLATNVMAQLTTSKVEGTVRDKDTGQPLVGAQVLVAGTRLGNVTNNDGYYFILNVPPGQKDITFTFTGYQTVTIKGNLLLAGQTATVNGELSSSVVQLQGITVEGEAEVLMPRDNTATKQRLTAETINETPATRLEDMMILEAGVQIGGRDALDRGLRIRGGRLGEEGVVVDGVMVRNYTADPFSSGQGWIMEMELGSQGQDNTPLEFSSQSVEQVDIITGGFQAEYGNAQSGIVNIVTKEGGAQYKGTARMTSDMINPRTADYGYNQLQGSIGGPAPLVKNLYFFGSGELQGTQDRNPTHADEGFRGVNQTFVDRLNHAVRNDPVLGAQQPAYTLDMFKTGKAFYAGKTESMGSLFSPANPVRLPTNWQDRTLLTGKVTYSPIQKVKLIASENWSRNQNSYPPGYTAEGNYFQTGIIDKTAPEWDWLYSGLFDKSPYLVNKDKMYVWQSYARRARTNNLLGGMDWDFYRSAERSGALQLRYTNVVSASLANSSPKTDWQRDDILSWAPHDVQFEVERWPNKEGLYNQELRAQYAPDGDTGWKQGVNIVTPFMTDDPAFYYIYYNYLRESQNNYKADLDFQLNRWNRAKLGVHFLTINNLQFRTNYYAERRDPQNEFRYKPEMYAGYFQNRTDLGDFVFDYGLRYDGFQHNTNWGITSGDAHGASVRPRTLHTWSPRFDVGFPVTDKAQLRFSYGVFTQLPNLGDMFAGSSGGSPFNNPGGLEYARTDAFESGISYLLSDDIVFDVVAFYRDVTGNVSYKAYFRDYTDWYTNTRYRSWNDGLTNRDNGNIKGLDITLRKRFSKNFSFNLQYTLQFSRTTGDAYNSPTGGNYDATSNAIFAPPDEQRPINGDRSHKLVYTFNYLFPEDYKAGTLANTILKNFRAYAIFQIQSGEPLIQRGGGGAYTAYTDRALTNQFGGFNFFRGRWFTDLQLRFTKGFNLGASRKINIFTEVFNTFNRKNNQAYPTYSYEGYSHITGGVDVKWDDLPTGSLTRARFQTDFNGDGILTVEEAAKGAIAGSFADATMDKRLWGDGRQIRTGIDLTF